MDILYLLIPVSALLVLAILGVFAWALHDGQFDDLEREGERILTAPEPPPCGAYPPRGPRKLGAARRFLGSDDKKHP